MENIRDSDSGNSGFHDKSEEPCKFLTKDFDFANIELIKSRLTQNTGFLVVGVIGKQTVGKSFVVNMLANNPSSIARDRPFETASITDFINFNQKTFGIDLHITADRVILLDAQPILNMNHLAVSMEKEKKIKVYSSDDNENEGKIKMSYSPDILSVQIIAFLFSVCHTVLIVDDHSINYRLLRLIDLAHRLKPWISGNPAHLPLDEPRNIPINHFDFHNEFHDYIAQMVFVENMCQKSDRSANQIAEQLECMSQVLLGYRFRVEEQSALHGWTKDARNRRHNNNSRLSNHRRKLQQQLNQKEKPHHNLLNATSNVVCQRSENNSEEESQTRVAEDDETVDVSVSVTPNEGAFSDIDDDDEMVEKRMNRSIYRPMRLVKIPLIAEDDDASYECEARSLQQTVFRLPRKHFCVSQSERFTELCWFEYSAEMWHSIRNSNCFTDFFYSYSSILIGDL